MRNEESAGFTVQKVFHLDDRGGVSLFGSSEKPISLALNTALFKNELC